MSANNLVSINRVLSKVSRDFGLTSGHWHNSAIEWVAEAIREIGTIVPFEEIPVTKLVNDYKLLLPCNFNLIIQVKDKNGCELYPYNVTVHDVRNYEQTFNSPSVDRVHYTINGRYLNFSFTGEEVTIVYTDFAVDEEGYPMIVDTSENIEALSWYIIYKYLLSGNPHGVLNWKESYTMWIKYRDKATNSIMMPGPDNMKSIMTGWLGSIPNFNLKP